MPLIDAVQPFTSGSAVNVWDIAESEAPAPSTPPAPKRSYGWLIAGLSLLGAGLLGLLFIPGENVSEETTSHAIARPTDTAPTGERDPEAVDLPATFGLETCDEYVRLACSCGTEGICDSALRDFEEMRTLARQSSMRALVRQGCRGHIVTIADAC